ncbi:chaperone NapD [Halopseudomonas salegens]|uniref:Chaperone NapD n=1 Tax=Halopseudomonas salegens TaxID=1434072 RepID=A0A1H2H983_9GAMM|nr:chaperone NapD [Halopseudomonas salegens]SDU28372.1 periplasmic nitrate reductase chaperone NapD [Halopseudomonas salegens]
MADYVHIASLLVQVKPESMSELQLDLTGQPGIEVRAQSPQGKLVVVMETDQQKRILDFQASLHDRPGVLSCNLVYHEVVATEEADRPLDDLDISAD